jgi:alkanesulfonate monooxygenase SsuD/methylene tetrahydromethanopterin reductase-like flavin-dependent oxidoreductase (luciferase family)
MDVGVAMFATDRSWPVDDLAREVEARGLASLALPEHTHIPVDHTPHPSGQPLPDEYRRTLDPFVALAVAATVTEQLRLVTGVTLVAQRDPLVLAKEVATLDLLSGGRVTVGVGYGWNRPEVAHHGVRVRGAPRRRPGPGRRHALAVDARRSRPATGPSRGSADLVVAEAGAVAAPAVAVGGRPRAPDARGPRRGFDGWLPIGASAVRDGLPRLQDAWDAAGRPGRPLVHVYGTRPDVEVLQGLAALGVDAVSLWLPSAPRAEALPVLDAIAAAAEGLP